MTDRVETTEIAGIEAVAEPDVAIQGDPGCRALVDCHFCHREIEEERYYVVVVGGMLLNIEQYREFNEENDPYAEMPGFLGAHPVGPTCRKKVPSRFVGERDVETTESSSSSETESEADSDDGLDLETGDRVHTIWNEDRTLTVVGFTDCGLVRVESETGYEDLYPEKKLERAE